MFRRIYVTLLSAFLLAKWDWRISRQPYHLWQNALSDSMGDAHRFLSLVECRTLVRLLDRATRYHYRPMNCLRRCLALKDLLAYYNTPCSVRIGVRMSSQSELQAHAWVEVEGEVINDTKEVVGTYTEIATNTDLFNPQILK